MKILIVQIGKIGDMILTTPMFSQIKYFYPNSTLHILASPGNQQVLLENQNIDKIYVFKKKPFKLLKLLIELYHEKYTFWIDPKDHFSKESMILALFSHADTKIGYNKPNSTVFDVGIASDSQNYHIHAIERNTKVLEKMGLKSSKLLRPELYLNEALSKEVESLYKGIIPQLVILNISAGDKSRYWTIDGWIQLSDYIHKMNYTAIVIFHPKDFALAKKITNGSQDSVLFYSDTILEVSSIVQFAKLVVTPDTSIVHVASAYNIPIIALYPKAEWNINKFRPLSDWYKMIEPEDNQTIQEIKIEKVLQHVKFFFEQANPY